jgi:hypothetical protein
VVTRFASEASPSTHEVIITPQGGQRRRFPDLSTPQSDWHLCDWTVIFGPDQTFGRFCADNVLIEALAPDGTARPVFREDAEGPTPGETGAPEAPFALLSDLVDRYAPPPVRVSGPAKVRVGLFRSGNEVVVHAHNTAGTWRNWGQRSGPRIVLESSLPITRADLPLRGKGLSVARHGTEGRVDVPVSLYEVVTVRLSGPR